MIIKFIITLRTEVVMLLALAVLGWPAGVVAGEQEEIKITIKDHRFVPSEIRVQAQTKIRLRITNEDPSAEEFESFSLNREKIIRPGQTIVVFLPPLDPGRYDFFGEFHPDTAQGVIIVE